TTNSAGFYSFQDLLPSTAYTVTFTPPAEFKFTLQAQGSDNKLDSNAAPATGIASFTTPATGTNSLTSPDLPRVDAGLIVKTYAVGDYVWYDTDRDGVQDASEAPVPGVKVQLLLSDGSPATDATGAVIPTATTGPDGKYLFDLVPAGTYQVRFFDTPARSTFTTTTGGTSATDSNPAPSTGITPAFTLAPASSGVRAAVAGDGVQADYVNPTIDAGILRIDLELAKTLTATGPFYSGSTVTFELTPKNNGPVDALAGWKVTELLPTDLALVTMSGTGYTCSGDTCTATGPLAAGATGPVITVTATVKKPFDGAATNIAYVSPASGDTGETNALSVPTYSTDPATSGTNNDAKADLVVDPLVSVGDYVWQDNDRDGVQDSGEPPVKDVVVTLKDAAGVTVATTTTDANGFYSFVDLKSGLDYTVVFTAPANTTLTLKEDAAGTEATDSDADPATGEAPFTAPATGSNSATAPDLPSVDAGIVPKTFAVSNFVWLDTNRDGIQDAGELPVKDVTVTLVNPDGSPAKDLEGNDIAAVLTDADGLYVIDDVPAGDYQVKFTTLPSGATFTKQGEGTPATDSTPATATGTTGTFTLSPTATNVRAVAAADGTLVAGFINPTIDAGILRIDLELAKTLTATGPFYSGSTVTYELTPKNNGPVDALAGYTVTDVLPSDLTLVTMEGAGYSCSGAVCTADDPLAAGADGPVITVTATVNKPFDGAARNLAYVSPAPGETGEVNVLVVPALGADALLSTTNNDAQADLVVDPLVSVGDYVWQDNDRDGVQDSGEPPVKDVVVTLKDAAGVTVATTTTDANGFYSFVDLKSGQDYTVVFTAPADTTLTLKEDAAGTEATDSDADPATGEAAFTAPATGTNSATAPDLPSVDAGIVPKTFAVSNFVWLDTNRDGIQDAGELPVKDVTVTLVNPDGSPAKDLEGNDIAAVLTDADGLYVIDDVPAGAYQVKFTTLPSGATFTKQGEGTPATDSTPATATGTTGTFTLSPTATNVRLVDGTDGTLVAAFINPTIDAGILSLDLSITKTLTATGPFYAGRTVTYELVPRNNGPVDAIAGWK
ncbi:MAG: SdrD B-like domain-containing protein, partial [Angustibacter sp.]